MAAAELTLPDGRTLAYAEYADPDGTPLFFFHGLPGSKAQGAIFEAGARSAGFRMIAPERPGFGASTHDPDRTFASWTADVAALADHLDLGRFHVAGISGGGPYSLGVACGLPDRVIAAGVLSGGGDMGAPDAFDGMSDQNRALFELARGGLEALAPAMQAMAASLTMEPDEAMAEAMAEAQLAQLPPADAELMRRRPEVGEVLGRDAREAIATGTDGLAYETWLFTQPWPFDVADIRVPVVIWHGTDDRNAPVAQARSLAARIPGCRLVEYEGAGHLVTIDRAAEVFETLRKAGE